MKKTFAILAVIAGLTTACSDELENSRPAHGADGKVIELPLTLTADDEESYGETRALDDPDDATDHTKDGAASVIKDVWVLQFLGNDDNARLISVDTIADYSVHTDRTVKFTASTSGVRNTIVALANTCDQNLPFYKDATTLGEFKRMSKKIVTQADLFGSEPDPDASGSKFPNDKTYRVIMTGMMEVDNVGTDTEINLQLKRNVARVDFTFTYPYNKITINPAEIELRNVPEQSYYYTNRPDLAPDGVFPATGMLTTFRFKSPESYTVTTNTGTQMKTITLHYYVPANMRGVTVNHTGAQASKAANKPDDATYLFIKGEYTRNGENIPRTYTFYLGENLVNDFNIKPNHRYTYTVAMRDLGNADQDLRIDDYGAKDFTVYQEDANCYILNPPALDGFAREFRIPIRRIDEFWGSEKYEGGADTGNNLLGNGSTWRADIIWSDFKMNNTPGTTNTTQVCLKKYKGDKGKNDYFSVTVPKGVEGNVLIGVRKTHSLDGEPYSDEYLWSWHLWITDYNPDACNNHAITEGRYNYEVPGGLVQRYGGAAWAPGGKCANSFAMDRNIGDYAYGIQHINGHGSLRYEWGRKDPFPWGTLYGPDGKTVSYTQIATTDITGDPVRYAVTHPFVFIKENWCAASRYYNSVNNVAWNDMNVPEDKYMTISGMKSIFDPSPLGWCLIDKESVLDLTIKDRTAMGLKLSSTTKNATNVTGLEYWPGTEMAPEQPVVYLAHHNTYAAAISKIHAANVSWLTNDCATNNSKNPQGFIHFTTDFYGNSIYQFNETSGIGDGNRPWHYAATPSGARCVRMPK